MPGQLAVPQADLDALNSLIHVAIVEGFGIKKLQKYAKLGNLSPNGQKLAKALTQKDLDAFELIYTNIFGKYLVGGGLVVAINLFPAL